MKISVISEINDKQILELAEILISNIRRGASLGYLIDITLSQIIAYWNFINLRISKQHVLFLAIENNEIIGTAQLIFSDKQNGKFRGEIVKLIVKPECQARGVGSALLSTLELYAKQNELKLLILKTQTGSHAEKIYIHLAFQKAGEIPLYALDPYGELYSYSCFYKIL